MNQGKSKNIIRIILVVILIIAAAFTSFVILPALYRVEGATESVIMLREDVKAGTQITEDMIIRTEVGSYALDPSIIKTEDAVVGKYAVAAISHKDLLFPEKFADTPEAGTTATGDWDGELKENEMLVTLQLNSTAAGAAGNILPGDIVNVSVYSKDFFEEELEQTESLKEKYSDQFAADATTGVVPTELKSVEDYEKRVRFPEELQGLRVYRVLTAALTGVDPMANPNDGSNGRIPAYITLVCTQEQADMLVDYSYSYTIHFIETK